METKKEISKIIIEGKSYVPEDQVKEINGEIKIVILQRGFVKVGIFERNGNDCKLHNSNTIRTWGTTHGLGEIAKNGPTEKTLLNKDYGLVEFDYLTVIATICCEAEKWKNVL